MIDTPGYGGGVSLSTLIEFFRASLYAMAKLKYKLNCTLHLFLKKCKKMTRNSYVHLVG